jgi:hypothetical protein
MICYHCFICWLHRQRNGGTGLLYLTVTPPEWHFLIILPKKTSYTCTYYYSLFVLYVQPTCWGVDDHTNFVTTESSETASLIAPWLWGQDLFLLTLFIWLDEIQSWTLPTPCLSGRRSSSIYTHYKIRIKIGHIHFPPPQLYPILSASSNRDLHDSSRNLSSVTWH